MKKSEEYTAKLLAHIGEIFSEDCEFRISLKELSEDNNATEFIHALANTVPCLMYKNITGDDVNLLQFNHIANQLVFQNLKNDK